MTGTVSCVQLRTPLGDEVLPLKAGDCVELSGMVYTARDEAHIRMMEDGIPFPPRGAVIYHCGPVIKHGMVVAAGPTTSARMNEISGFLLDAGVRGLIGKGGMGKTVRDQIRGRGVYFAFTGGCAALASARMKLRDVYFKDLGMAEAIWAIELDHLPLVVGIDAHGNDIFSTVIDRAGSELRKYKETACSFGPCGKE
ncbi:MAG: FumA C-terminus/TtdB family hydratase beta subunit [Methanoregula sp.]|nr:FumA C-terminus/TtdB family hydratase beta subunit [Methanoregula sp.]